MKIILFGASGKTGKHLTTQALDAGHQVTAFVRNPAKLDVSHSRLTVFTGDVTDREKVIQGMAGHEAVFSTLGAASPFKYDATVVAGMQHIVDGMQHLGIKRLIYMSAINVGESRPQAGMVIRVLGPILLRTETAGHEAREKIIRSSPLDYTLVRPGALTDDPHQNYRHGEHISAKGPRATISRTDVADFMLWNLGNPEYLKRAPLVMY